MNKLAAIILIIAASFISSQNGDRIGDGELRRTGKGAGTGIVAVMIYAAIEMMKHKDNHPTPKER